MESAYLAAEVDVRIIAATNHTLRSAVAAGTFLADLYYRMSAFPIAVPPLRARRRDVRLLADRFLTDSAEWHRKKIAGIDPAAFALLTAYDWPGNIRQLRNEIERAVALTPQGGTNRAEAFSREIGMPGRAASAGPRAIGAATAEPALPASPAGSESVSAPTTLDSGNGAKEADLRSARTAFESRFIAEQLRNNGGNVSRTAEALGISRVVLQKKMKEYGLR